MQKLHWPAGVTVPALRAAAQAGGAPLGYFPGFAEMNNRAPIFVLNVHCFPIFPLLSLELLL